MQERFYSVLNRICVSCIEQKVDWNLLMIQLKIMQFSSNDNFLLTKSETELCSAITVSDGRFLKLFEILQSKRAEGVFISLQKALHSLNCLDVLDITRNGLSDLGSTDLIVSFEKRDQPNFVNENSASLQQSTSVISKNLGRDEESTYQTKSICTTTEDTVVSELKSHYIDDLEIMQLYWEKFHTNVALNMDAFYCYDIEIVVEKKSTRRVENFEHLFQLGYKRILIVADAGYGKSTFVHQLAREWVKGKNEKGEKVEWVNNYKFLFLFRLGELTEKDTRSLESMLRKCFVGNITSRLVYDLLQNKGNVDNSLFIFDGLDEKQHNFCEEIDAILYGTGAKLYNVIITSRPGERLNPNVRAVIKLKGFTERGVKRQMEKFSINFEEIEERHKRKLSVIFKVPLYLTFFCITYDDSEIKFKSLCSAIKYFVEYACHRYRIKNKEPFTMDDELRLLFSLGKYAQSKFLFIKGIKIAPRQLTVQQIITAKEIGLISDDSSGNIAFVHHTIAEYCSALFWVNEEKSIFSRLTKRFFKTFHKKEIIVKSVGIDIISLAKPGRGYIVVQDNFARMLTYLDQSLKFSIWKKFNTVGMVPLFDDYENLSKKVLFSNSASSLQFSTSHTACDQQQIMSRIRYSTENKIKSLTVRHLKNKEGLFENDILEHKLYLCQIQYKGAPSDSFICSLISIRSFLESLNIDRSLEYFECFIVDQELDFIRYMLKQCNVLNTLHLNLKKFSGSEGGVDFRSYRNLFKLSDLKLDDSYYLFTPLSILSSLPEMGRLKNLNFKFSINVFSAEMALLIKWLNGFHIKQLSYLQMNFFIYNMFINVLYFDDEIQVSFYGKKFYINVAYVSNLIDLFQIEKLNLKRCVITNLNKSFSTDIFPEGFAKLKNIENGDLLQFSKNCTENKIDTQTLTLREIVIEYLDVYCSMYYLSHFMKYCKKIKKISVQCQLQKFDGDVEQTNDSEELMTRLKKTFCNTNLFQSIEIFCMTNAKSLPSYIWSLLSEMVNLKVLDFGSYELSKEETNCLETLLNMCSKLERFNGKVSLPNAPNERSFGLCSLLKKTELYSLKQTEALVEQEVAVARQNLQLAKRS